MSALSRRVRRLEALEKSQLGGELVALRMPDGRAEILRGSVLELFSRARDGDRTPEVELIAQSISSTEPGGGQMIDLARALLNSPGIAEDMEGAFDATSVHPQKGFTGVVLLETGKPMTHVEPTPEEIESVRAGLQHRRGPQESFR